MSSRCGSKTSPPADIRWTVQPSAKKTERPVRFQLSEQTRQAIDDYLKAAGKIPGEFLFTGRRGW